MDNKEKKKKKSKRDLFLVIGVLIFIILFKLALVYQNSQNDNFNSGNYTETPKTIEESEVVEESEVLDTMNEFLSSTNFWTLLFISSVIYVFFGIILRFLRGEELI